MKGAGSLDPRGLAVLEALLEFRDIQAQKSDLPPFKVIRNEPLLKLAVKKPLSLEEMETGKVLSRKEIDRYGHRLLRKIQGTLALPEKDLPPYPREARPDWPSPVRHRIKVLKKWREQRAQEMKIEPGILMNNVLINALALKNPRSLKEMEEIPGLKGWFRAHFGREILAVQAGKNI